VKSLIKFFNSVKLAIVLIIVIIAASVLGTLIPQGRSAQEYAARYGQAAGLLIRLQITAIYHSVWYLGLLLFISLNIFVCTLTRLGPKWKKSLRPRVQADAAGLLSLKSSSQFKKPGTLEAWLERLRRELLARHYRVRETSTPPQAHVLARKRTLGWFGSDIVHLGLLTILAGGIVSGLAGHHDYLPLKEGQAAVAPRADFSVRLDKFETELYPEGSVKAWKSTVTVVEAGRDVRTHVVQVNHPLSYKGINFYQSSYGWDWKNPEVEVWVKKKSDPAYLEKRKLHPGEKTALPDGLELRVERFVPDFIIGQDKQVESRSDQLNNPAAQVEIAQAGRTLFSAWVFANYPDFTGMHSGGKDEYGVELKDVKAPQYSVLEAASDPGVNIIWVGSALVMAGLFLAFYWPTREIKAVLQAEQGKVDIALGGLTSKSREAFESEFQDILSTVRRIK
jgi:cytochrome c biogenesis protein